MGEKIGRSERELLTYLAENPMKKNREIAEDLGIRKSNVSHRLSQLEKKDLINTKKKAAAKLRYLTDLGLGRALQFGADLNKILKGYLTVYPDLKYLDSLNRVCSDLVGEKWSNSTILKDMIEVSTVARKHGVHAAKGAQEGLLIGWLQENLNEKERKTLSKKLGLEHSLKEAIEKYREITD